MRKFKMLKEEEILQLLVKIGEKTIVRCPVCNSEGLALKSDPSRATCTYSVCRKRFTIRNNTIFANSKISSILVLKILELCMQCFKINHISYVTGISRIAIWRVLLKMSKVIEEKNLQTIGKIGGKNVIVEIDESKFGKRKYNRGHRVEGVWILGMVERTPERKIILVTVDTRDSATLNLNIKKYVSEDSVIYTDKWRGYNKLCEYFTDHLTVNHSQNFKVYILILLKGIGLV